ncbi:MAG: hypothetical protein ACP5J4_02630 [Anaerolineae bacterium]
MKEALQQFITQLSGLRKLKPPLPPWLIKLVGLGLVALGIYFLAMYGAVQVLTCVHTGDTGITCDRDLRLWGMLPFKHQRIANITRVTVETSCRTGGRIAVTTCEYDTLTLHPTEGAPVALPRSYYNLPSVQEAATALQNYLDQPQSEPFVRHDTNLFMAWAGSLCVVPVFLICGILVLIFWREENGGRR